MNININDFNDIIFCAFRYALGRKTYIVSIVVDNLIKYNDMIYIDNKLLINKEILEAIRNNNAGMQMDIDEWNKVIEVFNEDKS